MRHRLVLAALSCSALLPCSALADTYDFSFTELSALAAGPVQYDFKLDTDLASATPTGADFTGVVISKNDMDQPAGDISLQNLTNIASSEFFLVDTDTPTQDFYSGTGKGIQFNTGTFSIADGFTDGEGKLTIADTAVSAAPEPGAWALMFVGVVMLGAMLRFGRRRQGAPLAV